MLEFFTDHYKKYIIKYVAIIIQIIATCYNIENI
jgi:hypothetical protein